jgi:hypothetical protein
MSTLTSDLEQREQIVGLSGCVVLSTATLPRLFVRTSTGRPASTPSAAH